MARAPSSTRKTRVLSNPNCGWHSRRRYRRGSAGRSFGSAQDRLQHASRVCPNHFIRSKVFWRTSRSLALPTFSRVFSIHFFSNEFFVGRSVS